MNRWVLYYLMIFNLSLSLLIISVIKHSGYNIAFTITLSVVSLILALVYYEDKSWHLI